MPALHTWKESQPDIVNHATNFFITLISGLDEAGQTGTSLIARAENASMRKAATGLWSSSSVDAAGILAAQQRRHIQIICSAMSSVSIFAAICAIYWFCMMRRNYRRDLVLMLILGDFYKSLWYLIHGSVNFARSQVRSEEVFCQVSGFMLQVGLQACGECSVLFETKDPTDKTPDVAILFISMHMALQIFPPANSFLGHDGLYKVRRWVFATWILLPCFTASLAFANPNGAYQAQGAFCWLPIRPFWYRLALSWVPRYLIWLYIMWVAIRIYSHVGYTFRVFGQEKDRSSSTDITDSTSNSAKRGAIEKAVKEHRSQIASGHNTEDDDIAPDDSSQPGPTHYMSPPHEHRKASPVNASRRMSLPTWHSPFGGISSPHASTPTTPTARSNPTSRRGSRQIAPGVIAEDFMAPPCFDTHPRGSISTITSLPRSFTANSIDQALPTITETRGTTTTTHSTSSSAQTDIGRRALRQRRRAIQRQLRILFIYPVVYMLMWLIPFLSHCMSYSDRFAQHPVFAIRLLTSFCQSFMGFADVCVFCWRERPWRHCRNSDGTFFGSFVFWRDHDDSNGDWSRRESRAPSHMPSIAEKGGASHSPTQSSQAGLLASLRRWSMSRKSSSPNASIHRPALAQKRAFSGGAGRQTKEAELAHERLRMEREDYQKHRASLDQKRESVTSPARAQQPRKEWFDQNISADTLEVEERVDLRSRSC